MPDFLALAPETLLGTDAVEKPIGTVCQLNWASGVPVTPGNTAGDVDQWHMAFVFQPQVDSWSDVSSDTYMVPLLCPSSALNTAPDSSAGCTTYLCRVSSTTARLVFVFVWNSAGGQRRFMAASSAFTLDRRRVAVEVQFDTSAGIQYRMAHAAADSTGKAVFGNPSWVTPTGSDLYTNNTALGDAALSTNNWSWGGGFGTEVRHCNALAVVSIDGNDARSFLGIPDGTAMGLFGQLLCNQNAGMAMDTELPYYIEYHMIRHGSKDDTYDANPPLSECVYAAGYETPDDFCSASGGASTGFKHPDVQLGDSYKGFVLRDVSSDDSWTANNAIDHDSVVYKNAPSIYFGDIRDSVYNLPEKVGDSDLRDAIASGDRKSIVIFGDSTHTQGGNGDRYLAKLVNQIAKRGKFGGTGCFTIDRATQATSTSAMFFRGQTGSPTYTSVTVADESAVGQALPAGLLIGDSSTAGPYSMPQVRDSTSEGAGVPLVLTFAPGGLFTPASTGTSGDDALDATLFDDVQYFTPGATVRCRVTFIGHGGVSGTDALILVRGGSDADAATGWAAASGNLVGSAAISSIATADGTCSGHEFTFDLDGSDYYHIGFYAGAGTTLRPVAIEIWEEGSKGVSLGVFADGGLTARRHANNDGLADSAWDISSFVAAAGLDGAILAVGTNDSGFDNARLYSPQEYRAAIKSIISSFRSGVPDAPMVLLEHHPVRWNDDPGTNTTANPTQDTSNSFRRKHATHPIMRVCLAEELSGVEYMNLYKRLMDLGTWYHPKTTVETTTPLSNSVETGIADRLQTGDPVHADRPLAAIDQSAELLSMLGINAPAGFVPQVTALAAAASFAR